MPVKGFQVPLSAQRLYIIHVIYSALKETLDRISDMYVHMCTCPEVEFPVPNCMCNFDEYCQVAYHERYTIFHQKCIWVLVSLQRGPQFSMNSVVFQLKKTKTKQNKLDFQSLSQNQALFLPCVGKYILLICRQPNPSTNRFFSKHRPEVITFLNIFSSGFC